MGKFQSLIIRGKVAQPNSRKYRYSEWKKSYSKHGTDEKDLEIYFSGLLLYRYLSSLRKSVKHFKVSNLSKKEAILGTLALLNREYCLLDDSSISIANGDSFSAEQFLQSPPIAMAGGGTADRDSVLESIISSARYAFQNGTLFSDEENDEDGKHLLIKSLAQIANLYNTFIEVWHGLLFGYFKVVHQDGSFHLIPADAIASVNREIAITRRKSHFFTLALTNCDESFLGLELPFLEYDSVNDSIALKEMDKGLKKLTFAGFCLYCDTAKYFFKEKLQGIGGLTIAQLWSVLSLISFIPYSYIEKLKTIKQNPETFVELMNFSVKIKESEFNYALRVEGHFDEQQCKKIIELLSCDFSSSEDIATKFFIRLDGYLYPITPTFNPNKQFIAEHWLKKGGVELADRGKQYESDVRSELISVSSGFLINIFKTSLKFNVNSKYEEIDCAFVFGDTLYVCEMKCSLYPSSYRERFDYDNLIKEAVDQIERKAAFVTKNLSQFSEKYFRDSNISLIKTLVITNQFEHSGTTINNTHIIDDSALIKYFRSNKIEVKNTHGGVDREEDIAQIPGWQRELLSQRFYEKKEEAHLYFECYLQNLPQVELFRKNVSLLAQPITPANIVFYVHRYGVE